MCVKWPDNKAQGKGTAWPQVCIGCTQWLLGS